MKTRDSLLKAKEEGKELKNELKNIKDTLQSEDNLTEAELRANKGGDAKPPKDTQNKKRVRSEMVAPDKQKQPGLKKDSVRK